MNRSLLALWTALAAAVITIAVFAQFWIAQRDRSSTARVQELLTSQLSPVNQTIKRVTDQYAVELEKAIAAVDLSDLNDCVKLKRSPLIRMLIVVDGEQQLLYYPRELRNATLEDRALIDETQQMLRDRFPRMPVASPRAADAVQSQMLPASNVATQAAAQYSLYSQTSSIPPASAQQKLQRDSATIDGTLDNANAYPSSKWVTWYHRRGLMIGHVWQQDQRWQAVAVLPRARWMADIVSALAEAGTSEETGKLAMNTSQRSLRQLVDVEGKVVHQWSSLPQSQWSELMRLAPDAEIAVGAPLEGWRLREFASTAYRDSLAGDDLRVPIWLAVSGLSLSLMLTGLLVTLNVNRQIRLAQQRVSFVNQVSHELRTPLTNICMYADLVAQSLEREESPSPEESQQKERLSVIRSESQRLTRLVNNVLEFARPVPTKALQRSAEELDSIVAETLATFEPKLCELGFEIHRVFNCEGKRMLDRGAVEQILVNLIGNAEKYAACGKYLQVATRAVDDQVEITVTDRGPGIPARMRELIFKPFVRLTDRLEDPTGTGIGLSIARELAKRHGGTCELLDSAEGAIFRCTLHAPQLLASPSPSTIL